MKNITVTLSEAQAKVIINHIEHDISFGCEGTFSRWGYGANDLNVDNKDIAIAKRAIDKIKIKLEEGGDYEAN